MSEIEIHPHQPFVPKNATILILGTFPGKSNVNVDGLDEWFYASKRNQFWNIIRGVYNKPLLSTAEKKQLFTQKGIAIGDIFLKIRRKENNNSDSSLEIVEYNDKALREIINSHDFKAIYCTSQFVEKMFKKLFPDLKIVESLPSPSPRSARMSLPDKIAYYKKKLPQ
jgi:hypoxanthine-DNA glycosylase